MGRGSDIEVRLGNSDRRGMVAISWYFWFAAAISRYFWFAAARSICSWVCVNFDLIFFFVGHLVDLEFAIGLF